MSDTNTYAIRDGIIVSPGKFEGEPRYATAMWQSVLEGFADNDLYSDDCTLGSIMLVTPDDVASYPELKDVYAIHLYEDGNGFVHTSQMTKEAVDNAIEVHEALDIGDSNA